ncbi:MAG: PLP-dependent aminotransferase family protein [Hahellaceae bacterium]|nr:PLP-dependent aminotransferase family protein [Hahellaceae bacterium]
MEVTSLSAFSFDSDTPLQAQLHRFIIDWIFSGRLLPGTRLPSSRKMADELKISRNTVTLVIEQLKSEGFLDSQPGRGVYVCADLPSHGKQLAVAPMKVPSMHPRWSRYGNALLQQTHSEHSTALPFTPGIPDIQDFPLALWTSIQRRHQHRRDLLGYHDDQGYLPLRLALADYLCLSRGVRCTSQQIIITQGAQQAISLCAQLLLDEGDQVLTEDPGYGGARKAFMARGATVVPCPLGEHGINIEQLPEYSSNQTDSAKLLYITPTHQYPLGGILPAAQRLALLEWATNNNIWLLEDDYDSEFHFHHKPIASLQGMAENSPVFYMGSFSKTLFPALRLGYLVVPETMVAPFVQAKSYMCGETPTLTQAVVADFISEGHFVRHLRKMRKIYEAKWQHLLQLITTTLTGIARPIAQSAGMHLAIEIPGIDDKHLKQQFAAAGFGSSSLSSYFLDSKGSSTKTGLVLGFANTTSTERIRGVKALSRLIPLSSPHP